MKQINKLILLFIFASHFFLSAGQEKTIRIVATSDLHGTLFPFDFLNDTPGGTSLASLETFLDSIRAIENHNTILLDNGDLTQGTPAAYYANFIRKNKKNLFSSVMNRLQYDAATLGNHDIETGPAVYNRLRQEFEFPWLGANIIDTETGKPAFIPYTMLERDGVRIAILGLITPAVPDWLPPSRWKGLEFRDMEAAASFWADSIRNSEKPDLVVGLFHTGKGGEVNNSPGKSPENAGLLIAKNIPGFDLIILGHDHRPIHETIQNSSDRQVILINPGSHSRQIAYIEFILQKIENNKYIVVNSTDTLISLQNSKPSVSYLKAFAGDIRQIRKYAGKPVAHLEVALTAIDGLFGNSGITDLVHRMQLETTGADISFTAPFSTSENLAAGPVRNRDLFKLYRYDDILYTMKLTGKEIKDFLEYSYGLWFNQMRDADDNLLNFRRNSTGQLLLNARGIPNLMHPSYNFDSAAGINYVVDVSKPAGNRITVLGFENGKCFSADSTYRVALNSYRGSGGGGHLTEGAGIPKEKLTERITGESDHEVRTILSDYLKVKKRISPVPAANWKVVPEIWWERARHEDARLLKIDD